MNMSAAAISNVFAKFFSHFKRKRRITQIGALIAVGVFLALQLGIGSTRYYSQDQEKQGKLLTRVNANEDVGPHGIQHSQDSLKGRDDDALVDRRVLSHIPAPKDLVTSASYAGVDNQESLVAPDLPPVQPLLLGNNGIQNPLNNYIKINAEVRQADSDRHPELQDNRAYHLNSRLTELPKVMPKDWNANEVSQKDNANRAQNANPSDIPELRDQDLRRAQSSKRLYQNIPMLYDSGPDHSGGHNRSNSYPLLQQAVKKQKYKQWESYDYENPYSLLEIHIDLAPDHTIAAGEPWPIPQSIVTSMEQLVVDMEGFRIYAPLQSCARVDRAIKRYARLINSKVDLFIQDGEIYMTPDYNNALRNLTVVLTRSCKDADIPHEHMSEQYKLNIDSSGARLTAQEPWGVIRGLETFSQLIHFKRGYAVVNHTYIKDWPRFGFRGVMLDTARHFIPIKNIKRALDAMSYNKFNVFHWHIVDDQSFPYVSKAFPDLSAKGAFSHSQTYSSSEIEDLVQYAADRAIRIIPEFDTPGHTRSWGLGYPQLLTNCSSKYHPFGAINPIQNYTYEFLSKLWADIHGVFPDSYIHVGGDEINYKCWLKVKAFRDFMIEHNMTKDVYDYLSLDGDRLQGHFLKRLIDVLPKDRKKIAWEEAFSAAQYYNVSSNELIFNVWKGGDYEWQYTMENVVRKGYQGILSACWYLNYVSYGRDWTKYYDCDPHTFLMYSSGAADYKDSVLGGQVCLWAEFIDESNLESTLWPRAIAPAEKLWSDVRHKDWRLAEHRFETQSCRMIRRGLQLSPNSGPGTCAGLVKIKPPYAQP